MSDDNINGVAKFMIGNSNMLREIDASKEVVELNSLWIKKIINMYKKIINMYVEDPSNEEFL